jgi:phenylpropionate dioxygenase-like ring-hydroxylating dioxygenase large terminal subunit
MASNKDRDLLVHVGPGTPMGDFMRQYWIPAALSSEFKTDGDPVRLKLLGEELIGFRDTNGRLGVMDHRCPHRCASLFFGRNEEGGLRCVYHGWKFDADGNCVDMANVPPHQDFKHKVHAKAYTVAERNNLVWVFMGDQTKVPDLPKIEATLVAERDNNIDLFMRECNWLQALEGDLDTSHVGFLHGGHRKVEDHTKDDMLRYGTMRRDPEYDLVETDYGAMYGAYRPAEQGNLYWRIGHFMYPFWSITPSAPFDLQVYARAWVPLDDTHTMSFRIVWKEGRERGTRSESGMVRGSGYLPNTSDWLGRWRLKANRANDYLIDRKVQTDETYTGVVGISEQDQMVTESMGPITDWDFEHLAPSDRMITTARRRLLNALNAYRKDGKRPPCADTPETYYQAHGGYFEAPEGIPMTEVYKRRLEQQRAGIPYAVAASNPGTIRPHQRFVSANRR